MTKILFIVNDIAGGKSKRGLPGIIRRHLDSEKFQWELEHTQYKGHATELARETDADWVVAVGAYDYRKDPLQKDDLLELRQEEVGEALPKLKSLIQQYICRMLEDKLTN